MMSLKLRFFECPTGAGFTTPDQEDTTITFTGGEIY